MASSNAGTLVSCDWNPFLLKVPELIHQLGYCAALAATREAAQIKLSGHNIEYPGLATNLVAVTSQGQDAFLKAYSDMLQIASKTNNMGKIGGILDQVVERFSDASAERSTKRLLDRLQSDINACDASGKRTKEDFQSWQEKVRSVRTAVHGAQTETNENLAKTENTMTSLGAHMARTYIDLDQAQKEKDVAQKKHAEALRKQYEREAELNSFAAQAGRMSLAFSFGMVGVVAGAGASLYLSASAAGTVAKAEAELERQRQKARDLDYGLQTVAVELKSFAHENQGLGVLMQAIVKVLAILDELTDNIKELITYFARINNEIRNLVAEHESQVKKIAQDKANGIQMEDVDYMDFQASALEMKKHSLNIHALSTLYSTVITEVINPGFSLALKSSHHTEGSSALVVANKEEGLKKYLADAEKFCSESSLKANQTLLDRLDELDSVPQRQRPRRAAASLPPSITSRTGPDTGRNSRFSRLNPFRRDR